MNNSCSIPPYISSLGWNDPARAHLFQEWLRHLPREFALLPQTIRPASADASFRRYFRILAEHPSHASYIIMDAPPALEDSHRFVSIAKLMQDAGIRVPEILNWDEVNGFLLLSDLGSQTFLEAIHAQPENTALADDLFKQAIPLLTRWQLASQSSVLPPYDEVVLRRELDLFPEWYIAKHRQIELDSTQKNALDGVFKKIIQHNLASAPVYVHRDFMPRNLMVGVQRPDHHISEPGVLDFQDALYGPITYDIASLMRDAFHTWDEEFVLDITIHYWEAARKAGLPVESDFSDFWVAVEWMGLQRHLKILGIFARLTL
ncbi:MAG: aminoglycoside phosphotransferase family protein, partial [Saezia sp.]